MKIFVLFGSFGISFALSYICLNGLKNALTLSIIFAIVMALVTFLFFHFTKSIESTVSVFLVICTVIFAISITINEKNIIKVHSTKKPCVYLNDYLNMEGIKCSDRALLLSIINSKTTEYIDPDSGQITTWSQDQYNALTNNWPELNFYDFKIVRDEYQRETKKLFCSP